MIVIRSMIYVSFPKPPNHFPRKVHWHGQLSHHVYWGLVNRLGRQNVDFVKWKEKAPVKNRDLLVTCLPNNNYHHTNRIIGVENDTLIPARWSSPTFGKFGIDAPVDDLRALEPLLKRAAGYCVLSNDVALGKLRSGDPETCGHVEHFKQLVGGNYVVAPHPIDKQRFRRIPKRKFSRNGFMSRHRMMIYHKDWRKSSQAAIDLLLEMGYRQGREFGVVNWVNKNNPLSMRRFTQKYNIVFSGSYSETGPANILEFLTQGFLIAGHEDWWDGYGFPQTVWSYDPRKGKKMKENLAYLLDDGNVPEMEHNRDRILTDYLAREDNEWDYFCDRLVEVIKRAQT